MGTPAIHPGEHLAEELNELDMGPAEFARQLDLPANHITDLLAGKRGITGDTALRLAHYFGTSAEFWMNLQKLYELRRAAENREDEVVSAYRSGSVSLSQAASLLGIDVWAYFDVLSRRGETINTTLEDWIDSESSL